MPTIRARKAASGETRYQVVIELKDCPPERRTFKLKRQAVEWGQAREAELKAARRDPKYRARQAHLARTVGELIDRHLQELERDEKPHLDKRRQHMAWWRAAVGNVALSDVTPALIAEMRDRLLVEPAKYAKRQSKLRTPATANRYLASLARAFTVAVKEWHWLDANPLRNVSRKTEPRGRVRYLSEDERMALLQACERSELPVLRLIVLIALTTGMRRGEILALRWQDVDLQRNVIVIHKTKNNERRAVPIAPNVKPLLDAHNKVRRIDGDLVFPHPEKADRPVAIDGPWQDAILAAKVEDFRFHDLRHTAASYLAMSGATTAELAAVLGHKTLAMVKRYTHLSEQHTAGIVTRMTQKFFGG